MSVFGNTAAIASLNPVRLFVQAMRISSTFRFFRLFSTEAQNFDVHMTQQRHSLGASFLKSLDCRKLLLMT